MVIFILGCVVALVPLGAIDALVAFAVSWNFRIWPEVAFRRNVELILLGKYSLVRFLDTWLPAISVPLNKARNSAIALLAVPVIPASMETRYKPDAPAVKLAVPGVWVQPLMRPLVLNVTS